MITFFGFLFVEFLYIRQFKLFFISDQTLCTKNDTTALLNDCQCDSTFNTHDCFTGQFCWSDSTCNPHPRCEVNDEYQITENDCQCDPSETFAECSIGKYCITGNTCSDDRNCFFVRIFFYFITFNKNENVFSLILYYNIKLSPNTL